MSGKLSALTLKDLPTIRAWRNHADIKSFMCSQHFIEAEEHKSWFVKQSKDPLQHLYLYEEEGQPLGFLQLQKKSAENATYTWGFYISPDAPRGTGFNMTTLGLSTAFETLGAHKVFGEVLAFNPASIRLHQKLGFTQEGCLKQHQYVNGQYYDVYCFGLFQRGIAREL